MDAKRSGDGTANEPCTVVLFGASGDLAKRKVIPAMFDLASHNALGSSYAIVGFARTPMNDESFRSSIGEAAKSDVGNRADRFEAVGGVRVESCIITPGNTATPRISRSWRSI